MTIETMLPANDEMFRAVPYGETRSYADQARAIGRPDAVRAVGRGRWRKRSLLDHERRTLATLGPAPTID